MYKLMTLENRYYQIKPGRKKTRDYLIGCIHCQNIYHLGVVFQCFKFNNENMRGVKKEMEVV